MKKLLLALLLISGLSYGQTKTVTTQGVTSGNYTKAVGSSAVGNALIKDSAGTITSGSNPVLVKTLQIKDGNQGSTKVLTSDASGNATWQAAPAATITCDTNEVIVGTGVNAAAGASLFKYDPTDTVLTLGDPNSEWEGGRPTFEIRKDQATTTAFLVQNNSLGTYARSIIGVRGRDTTLPAPNANHFIMQLTSENYSTGFEDVGILSTGGNVYGGMKIYVDDGPLMLLNRFAVGVEPNIYIKPFSLHGIAQAKSGYVGINNSNPLRRLDVRGSAIIRDSLFIGTSTGPLAGEKLSLQGSQNSEMYSYMYNGNSGASASAAAVIGCDISDMSIRVNSSNNTSFPGVSNAYIGGGYNMFIGSHYSGSSLNFVTNSYNLAGVKMKISSTGIINVANAPTYADDTAAGVGGLVTGDIYQQTTTHFLMIKQ